MESRTVNRKENRCPRIANAGYLVIRKSVGESWMLKRLTDS